MPLDMGRIFPIFDAPSARLMKLKAACLFRAGVLSTSQRAAVRRRVDEVLARTHFRRSRGPSYGSKTARSPHNKAA